MESYSVSDNLKQILNKFIHETGIHNGGDCATISKFIEDYLQSIDVYDYSFSGEIIDGALSHIFVKFRGNYYDGVEGLVNKNNHNIVDNLQDNGTAIGSNDYGYINYQYGRISFKSSELYSVFNDIVNLVEND